MTQITMQTPMAIGNLMLIMKDHSNLNQKTTELFVIHLRYTLDKNCILIQKNNFQSYVMQDPSQEMAMQNMTLIK